MQATPHQSSATNVSELRTTLSRFRHERGFAFTIGGNRTLLSDCFGMLAAELFGGIDSDRSWYEKLAQSIASHQAEDGFFRDPQFKLEDLKGSHDATYLLWQQTYFALHALDVVGVRPPHRLAFLDAFQEDTAAIAWLRERDYVDFWYGSNEIMWLMSFLAQEGIEGDSRMLRVMDAMLDELDATQDPKTGYWGTDRGATLFNGMAGAFHIYYFYFWRKRPINHVQAIIDNTLALQHRDGLFHANGGGGTCHDLDAVDILVKFSMLSDHRAQDVASALDRAWHGLPGTQNPDGAFCERRWRPRRSWKRRLGEAVGLDRLLGRPNPICTPLYRYSGWDKMSCPVTTSNIWAMWFRPLALTLIQTRYPDRYGPAPAWTFRRLPGLGWHDKDALSALQMEGR